MLSATLLSVFLALLSSSTIQAVPLPSDCTCDNSPLSARTVDYIFRVTKARHLTRQECAFICNPSPQRQQQTIVNADWKSPDGLFKSSMNASPVTSTSSSADSISPVVDSSDPLLKATTSSLPPSSKADSSSMVQPPIIFDPPVARPLPLFDIPAPAHRKDRHRRQPARFPSNHRAGKTSHARAQSTMSPQPQQKALLPCALRVGASLVLLFVIAVCVVELGDVIVLLFRRRIRGRGYSNSGRLRLDEEGTSEKTEPKAWRPWRR
ncbi:hypothetical protein MMC18_008109 [Xylographa bjoerkii]|nr:hypothetical protein [Xylographa bjoerkii]